MKKKFKYDPGLALIKKRPINLLASLLTLISLYMGSMSIFASIGQEFDKAAYLILGAIIFDGLDGTVARLTKSVSEFGKELDSLCDLVSFGVAPGVMVFCAYLPDTAWLPDAPDHGSFVGRTGSFMAIVYIICTALRLARFNTYQADCREYFTGLPSPAAGGFVAAFVLFLQYFEPHLEMHKIGPFTWYALAPLSTLVALLMVSKVRYPKDRMKTFILKPDDAFFYLGAFAFTLIVAHYAITTSPSIVLFPILSAYVFFGMAQTLYLRYRPPHISESALVHAAQEQSEKSIDALEIKIHAKNGDVE